MAAQKAGAAETLTVFMELKARLVAVRPLPA
jgi:hypothetical protein